MVEAKSLTAKGKINSRPCTIEPQALVPYMDSCGLATLIEALQITRAQKTKLIVCNLSARVRSVFELSRLTTVLTVVDSHEQSLLA